jgi:hypothetical protein
MGSKGSLAEAKRSEQYGKQKESIEDEMKRRDWNGKPGEEKEREGKCEEWSRAELN